MGKNFEDLFDEDGQMNETLEEYLETLEKIYEQKLDEDDD
jgi:hypothetical protein